MTKEEVIALNGDKIRNIQIVLAEFDFYWECNEIACYAKILGTYLAGRYFGIQERTVIKKINMPTSITFVPKFYSAYCNKFCSKLGLLGFSAKTDKFYSYIMRNNKGLIKVGYSNNPNRRIKELDNDANYGSDYRLHYVFEFDNCEDAYEMEIWLHRYYKHKGYTLKGNDHFKGKFNFKDTFVLEEKAKEIRKESKKWLDNLDI